MRYALNYILVVLLSLIFSLPFCVAGIVVTFALVIQMFGFQPGDALSWGATSLLLFLLPVGIVTFALVGYALLVIGLRLTGLEPWFDSHTPVSKPNLMNAPFRVVRSLVHHFVAE